MPLLNLLAPVGFVGGIFLIHLIYYLRHCGVDTQQVIKIEDCSSVIPTARALAKVGSNADDKLAAVLRQLQAATGTKKRPNGNGQPVRRAYARKGFTIAGQQFPHILICADDLMVEHNSTFHSAVKVSGDLLINGDAVFKDTVIVNGYVRVAGSAQFCNGLLVKSDMHIPGHVTVGSADVPAWLVARRVHLDGALFVNGDRISENAACWAIAA